MVPMRSVPHRVVCLVGLDDGVFPRQGVTDGDDVLARDPVTGERDSRSEDRQLLLDAVGAATEKLVITYTGANAHTGQTRPPAVPLAELLDAVDATTPEIVRARVVVHHPLQPFDIRNVMRGELVPDEPFTFDTTVLKAAQTSTGQRREQPKFVSAPCPRSPTATSPSPTWSRSSRIRSRASSARWSTRCRGTSTVSPTRSPSTSTPSSSGPLATGC